MPKFNEYTEKTNPDDVDIFLLQDAASTKKISFLNIFNQIKTKLGLGDLATKSKVAQSDLEDALTDLIAGKLTSSGIANDLTTTDITKVLSAPQGKVLRGYIGTIPQLLTADKTSLVAAINELVTSLTTLNSKLSKNATEIYLNGTGQDGAAQNVVFNTNASRSPVMFYCTQADTAFAFMVAINGDITSIKEMSKQIIAGTVPSISVAAAGSAPGEMRFKLENKTSMGTLIHIVYGHTGAEWLRTSNA